LTIKYVQVLIEFSFEIQPENYSQSFLDKLEPEGYLIIMTMHFKSTLKLFPATCLILFLIGANSGCVTSGEKETGGPTAVVAKPPTPAEASTVNSDWLYWRGPLGSGVSRQTGLPDALDLNDSSLLWTHEIQGGGVPVAAGGRIYHFGTMA
jgi:hypothetical protein